MTFEFDYEGFIRFLAETPSYRSDWSETLEDVIYSLVGLLFDIYWIDKEDFIYRLYNVLPSKIPPEDIERFIIDTDEDEEEDEDETE